MILSIQYLRGLAAMLVLLGHSAWKGEQYAGNPMRWFHIGAFGVDVFFVISGFVMCHTTKNKHCMPREVVRFLVHRFIRIIPLYWTLSTVALLVFLIFPNLVNSSGGNTDILKSYLLIPTNDKYLIEAGWTLSYELFFYGLFAIGLFMPRACGHIMVSLALFVLFLIGCWLSSSPNNTSLDVLTAFATHNILLNFIFGIVLYHLYFKKVLRLSLICLVLFSAIIWITMLNQDLIEMPIRGLRYGVPAFLLCWGIANLEKIFVRSPSRFFGYIGDASYSIYLTHPFALALGALILKKTELVSHGWLFIVIIIFIAMMSGFACYEIVEKRLLYYFRNKIDGIFDNMARKNIGDKN